MNIRDQLARIASLQDAELRLGRIEAELASLPGERREQQLCIKEARLSVEEAVAEREESLKAHRLCEGELQDVESKIDKFREQEMLVRTNTQLWAVQAEINQAQNAATTIETKILEEMERADHLELEIGHRKADLELAERVTGEEIAKIDQRQDELEVDSTKLAGDVNDLKITVDVDLQTRYEQVKTRRGGVAIGEAVNETCQACNVRMRPQLWLEGLNMETLAQCDNCQRILFARDALELPSSIKVTPDD